MPAFSPRLSFVARSLAPPIVALLILAGCSPAEPPAATGGEATATATAAWIEIEAPAWSARDYRLPPSCLVEDMTQDHAIYQQNLHQAYPGESFGLLDLATGEYFTILGQPVNASESFFMCAPRIGAGWIAWEEVSPNEATQPDNAEWRLYAAPVDFTGRRLGEPVLIDSGNTSLYARPFYGFDGDRIIWSRNLTAYRGQEQQQHHSQLLARALPSGVEAVLFDSQRNWRSLCVQGDTAAIIEAPEPDESSERIVIVDAASGAEIHQVALPADVRSGHFARLGPDGTVLYAAFGGPNAEWPTLHAVPPGGSAEVVRSQSMDPVNFGEAFVFERVVSNGPRGVTSQLWGMSPASHEVWLLDERSDGLWQTPMCASTDDAAGVLAVALDLAPYMEDQTQAYTLVRVYRTE